MMKIENPILTAVTAIFFFLGMWPVGIISLIILLAITYSKNTSPKETSLEDRVKKLEEENQKLRQDLDDQKFIQDIIDKTSGK